MKVQQIKTNDGTTFYYCKLAYGKAEQEAIKRVAKMKNTAELAVIELLVWRIGNTFCKPADVTFTLRKKYIECIYKC